MKEGTSLSTVEKKKRIIKEYYELYTDKLENLDEMDKGKRKKLDPFISLCTKVNLKWSVGLNVGAKTMKQKI